MQKSSKIAFFLFKYLHNNIRLITCDLTIKKLILNLFLIKIYYNSNK